MIAILLRRAMKNLPPDAPDSAARALEGGCSCGAVRYSVQGEVLSHVICRCGSCRRVTGALQVPWFTVRRGRLQLLGGEALRRESSPGIWRSHCAACGTTLFYEDCRPGAQEPSDSIDITTASLDDPAALLPDAHIWGDDDAPWMRRAHALPVFRHWRSEGELVVPEGAPEDLTIALVDWAAARTQLLQIRTRVFVEEQGVPADMEEDERDPLCLHLLARRASGVVGAARLDVPLGGKLGRVAVLAPERRGGVGTALMRGVHALAAGAQLPSVWCHAQLSAVPFYERLGYRREGEEFQEAGIPHLALRRELADGD